MDTRRLRRRLAEAVEWAADATRPVDGWWAETARTIAECPTQTIVPALGAALLAKATYPEVDQLAIKEGHSPRAFSLRTVGHSVLVPASISLDHPFDLAVRGREPLNNQPFFRYDHWNEIARINRRAAPYYELAIGALASLDDEPDPAASALSALAAYLRERMAAAALRQRADLTGAGFSLSAAIDAVDAFVSIREDLPVRVQATAAALYELAHGVESVDSRGLYDPSRHGPGDVRVFLPTGEIVIAAETRGKAVTSSDAIVFINACHDAGITRAHLVVVGQRARLDRAALLERALPMGVMPSVMETVPELFIATLANAAVDLQAVLNELPDVVLRRLHELDAPNRTMSAWESACW